MDTDNIKRICLWSGPRNISTALMYSFSQRDDTKVFDEPLYAFYLKNTKAKEYHPGAEEILATMENDGNEVLKMMQKNNTKSVLFFKHMTKHLLDLDRGFMKNMVNIILTRNPLDMLPSFSKVIENPTMEDVGYKQHVELVNYFDDNNIKYAVLDSEKVILNPKGVLSKLCDFINIPFNDSMLKWKAEAIVEDGIWAKYWYKSIHNSNGFNKYSKKQDSFPEHLKPLLKQCEPYFNQLAKKAIS